MRAFCRAGRPHWPMTRRPQLWQLPVCSGSGAERAVLKSAGAERGIAQEATERMRTQRARYGLDIVALRQSDGAGYLLAGDGCAD